MLAGYISREVQFGDTSKNVFEGCFSLDTGGVAFGVIIRDGVLFGLCWLVSVAVRNMDFVREGTRSIDEEVESVKGLGDVVPL